MLMTTPTLTYDPFNMIRYQNRATMSFLHVDSEDWSARAAARLIDVFARCICQFVTPRYLCWLVNDPGMWICSKAQEEIDTLLPWQIDNDLR